MSDLPRSGDRLAFDPGSGAMAFHPAGPMIALTDAQIDDDGVTQHVIAHPFTGVPPLVAKICADDETSTIEEPIEGTTTPEPGECLVRVYPIQFVAATFPEVAGYHYVDALEKSTRVYYAAADPREQFEVCDLVSVMVHDGQFWIIGRLADCELTCASSTTGEPTSTTTTTTTTSTTPEPTTTEEPGTTSSTTTQEPFSEVSSCSHLSPMSEYYEVTLTGTSNGTCTTCSSKDGVQLLQHVSACNWASSLHFDACFGFPVNWTLNHFGAFIQVTIDSGGAAADYRSTTGAFNAFGDTVFTFNSGNPACNWPPTILVRAVPPP